MKHNVKFEKYILKIIRRDPKFNAVLKWRRQRNVFSSYQPSRRSVWENLDRGREYRPNAVKAVHTTEVKILPYRPSKLG